MYVRCALHLRGIELVADFYTPRNLRALALMWREIMSVEDDRVKRALAFAFTNTAWHGTRMRRFNARGGQRPLTGTLYIPQTLVRGECTRGDANKIAQLERYYCIFQPHGAKHLPWSSAARPICPESPMVRSTTYLRILRLGRTFFIRIAI